MRPEEIRSRGAGLADRVRLQVDTSARLAIMIRARRRSRALAVASAAAVMIVFWLGVLLLAQPNETPVVTIPPTTLPAEPESLQSLPVEVFIVLRSNYVVDPSGRCQGSGPLDGIGEGYRFHLFDISIYDSAEESPTIALPAGSEITAGDPGSSYLLSRTAHSACVFELPDLGRDISDYENMMLFGESDPDIESGMHFMGQRVVFTFGPVASAATETSREAGS